MRRNWGNSTVAREEHDGLSGLLGGVGVDRKIDDIYRPKEELNEAAEKKSKGMGSRAVVS